jgi:hypothetical protein
LIAPEDPVYLWRERLLDIHGGIARRALGFFRLGIKKEPQ